MSFLRVIRDHIFVEFPYQLSIDFILYRMEIWANHLVLEKGEMTLIKTILTPKPMCYDHVFVISIPQLVKDIADSITRQDGYLNKLQSGYCQVKKLDFERWLNR